MKKLVYIIVAFTVLSMSCRKITEDIINCTVESLFVGFKYNADTSNSKLIHFEVTYSSDYTLDNKVEWDFGDGHKETHGLKVDHEYDTTGNYHVKAAITIKHGNSSCTPIKEKTVDVD